MEYRSLGKSELKISRLGFGCMSLSQANKLQAEHLIMEAVENGINYFDTADLYDKGANETLLGKIIKPVRQKIVIATKVGNEWNKDGNGWQWNPRKSYILKAVDASLKRLQTDCIDLYQLHGGTIDDPIDETIEAFEDLVQQGKIMYYGISSIRPNVIKTYVERSNIKSVMMQYSILDRRPEDEMLPLLEKNNISVLARGVLAQGLLIDKPQKEYLGYTSKEVAEVQQRLGALTVNGISKAALIEQYILNHAGVTSLVIGFRTKAQLYDCLNGMETEISPNILKNIVDGIKPKLYTEHR